MRFVRVYTRADTGEIVAVAESEAPFEGLGVAKMVPNDGGPEVPIETHELGLVEHFEPTTAAGAKCSPAKHLFDRMERHADGFRAKHGHELPGVIDCPTSIDGVRQRLRERGVEGFPSKARAWLTLMLPPDQAEVLGVTAGVPLSALRALDAMRTRRDPEVASRAFVLERATQRLSDARSKIALERRKKAEKEKP